MTRRKSNFGRQVPTTDRVVGDANIEPLMPVEPLAAATREESQPQVIIQSNDSSDVRPVPKAVGSTNRRQKSKGGLQDMLQRNREREAREAQGKDAKSSNLSSFLQEL